MDNEQNQMVIRAKSQTAGLNAGNPYKPTTKDVANVAEWALTGVPMTQCAKRLKISYETFRRYLGDVYIQTVDNVTNKVAKVLVDKATKDKDVRAMTEWLDRRGGAAWQKKTQVEHTGAVTLMPLIKAADGSALELDVGDKVAAIDVDAVDASE